MSTPAAAARRSPRVPVPWLQPGIVIGGLVPLAALIMAALQGTLGANPIAEIENGTGLTALVLLIASLACSPLRRLTGWTWPMRIRRALGLLAFGYALLHFLVYAVLDQGVDLGAILQDIAERPFITVGFAALVLLTPLALTSTTRSIRRLGYRRWIRLHQLVYLAAALAVIHFVWRVKIDVSQPLLYAALFGGLILVRLLFWLRQRSPQTPPTTRPERLR
jgi:sulfoxide reductase heme-binding subunit YedZ